VTDGVAVSKSLADGDFDRALETAIEFGMAEGAKAERARIGAILRLAEAQTCVGTAILLALPENALTPACVRNILQAVPVLDATTANVVDVAARRAALKLIEEKR
jgi:hypothetical protein